VGIAAELLGLSLEAFERTMSYLRERRQFGRVIGSFQGLQHRAADLFAELELSRSIVLKALQAIDSGDDDLPRLASAAKAKLCEVATRASNEGIQMHGGVGMTDEYDIGLFLKRARVLQHWLGDQNYHLDRFARLSGF
jgi:alkylation response protein AidB-like acyl-CoA dehydrogenase